MAKSLLSGVLLVLTLGCVHWHEWEDDDWHPILNAAPAYETQAVAIADVAGNGVGAVLSANIIRNVGLPHPGFITTRLPDATGDGAFRDPIESDTDADPIAIALADLTGGTGHPDLVVAHHQVFADPSVNAFISIQKPNAALAGAFGPPTRLSLGHRNPRAIAIGDLNHDGLPDIAVAADGAESVLVFLQHADGTFTPRDLAVGGVPTAVAIGDLNHDGYDDLAVATSGNSLCVRLQDTATPGSFLATASYTVGSAPVCVKLACLSDAQYPDILTANQGTDSAPTTLGLSILRHDPAQPGAFLAATTLDTGDYLSSSVAVGGSLAGTYLAVANQGAPGWPGSISVFRPDAAHPGDFLAPDRYEGFYGPSAVAIGNVGGATALLSADGGTFLRWEASGQPGVFGATIQLRQ